MASISRQPNGRWRARWREYPGGPQRARHFDRKIDAERFLTEVEHQLLSGRYVDPAAGRRGFASFVEEHISRQPWRGSTEVRARLSLRPAVEQWGDRPISTIRAGDVQALVSSLLLAPSTVKIVVQQLRGVFHAAMRDGLIGRDPCDGVRAPRQQPSPLRVPTEDEVLLLFEESAPWFRPAVILGAGLGLRQGEAAGLTVDRIDFLRRTVTIDRQWSTPPSGPAGFAPPKTESSVRVIPAADVVLQALARHLELHGAGLHDVILHGRDGRPVNRTPFGRAWNATLQRAGIDDVRHHDLRHHYVSRAIASGCSVKAVQLALGHRSATTTLDVYGHLWPGDEDRLRAASEGLTFSAEDSLRTGAPLRPR